VTLPGFEPGLLG